MVVLTSETIYLSRKNLVGVMQINLIREDDSARALCIILTVIACPSTLKSRVTCVLTVLVLSSVTTIRFDLKDLIG